MSCEGLIRSNTLTGRTKLYSFTALLGLILYIGDKLSLRFGQWHCLISLVCPWRVEAPVKISRQKLDCT